MNTIEKIQSLTTTPELLCALAEEASELSQAALKYRRTLVSDSTTPVQRNDAWNRMLEEIGDVLLCIQTLEIDASSNADDIMYTMEWKAERWLRRLQDGRMPDDVGR